MNCKYMTRSQNTGVEASFVLFPLIATPLFLCSFLGLLGAALGAAALAEAGLALSAPLAISARRSRILASRLARSSSHAADA